MKVKNDFVTNSSSSSYIISIHENDLSTIEDWVDKVNQIQEQKNLSDYGVSIFTVLTNKKELDVYTNNGPLDWVQECTGPDFDWVCESSYKEWKKLIMKDKRIIVGISIDNLVNNNDALELIEIGDILERSG